MSVASGLATALTVVCGLLLALAAVVVADRPRGPVTAAAAGGLPYALQLGWPLLAIGLALPRWWLVAPAAVCCLTALVAATAASPRGRVDDQAPGVTLRVVTANIFYRNDDGAASWPIIAAFEPDVVLLQEVSRRSAQWLPPAGWHAEIDERHDAFGTAILTRIRPLAVERIDLAGLPQLRVRLRVGTHEITALSLHPRAPVDRIADRHWRKQFDALAELIRGDPAHILVAAGDFNATPLHRPMRLLLRRTGLVDARAPRRGIQGTWPSGGHGTPPLVPHRLMALDHVLVRGATVRSVRVLHGGMSDHHPLAVELALPPSS